MSWIAAGVAAGSVVSGIMGSSSAKRAGRQQAAAAREATALQREQYNTTRGDMTGYRDIGNTALTQMNQGLPDMTKTFSMSDFEKDPGYDFRMAEGQKALERSAAARGGATGGAAAKALSRYGQDYASGEYDKAYGRFNNDRDQRFSKLSSLMGVGQNAAAQTGSAGANYANNAGAAIIGGGNAQAASTIAGSNAWSNAINQGISAGTAYGGKSGGNMKQQSDYAMNLQQPANLSDMIRRA